MLTRRRPRRRYRRAVPAQSIRTEQYRETLKREKILIDKAHDPAAATAILEVGDAAAAHAKPQRTKQNRVYGSAALSVEQRVSPVGGRNGTRATT